MLDFQTWIERHLAKWTYRETAVAFLLVLVTVAVIEFLQVVRAAPVRIVAGATRPVAVDRWLNRDDPRAFLSSAALGNPGAKDGRFDIAWISGSPISIRKAPVQWRLLGKSGYEMTDVIARYLVSLDGEPVRVQEFLLQGTRTGDMRRAVLFAAAQPEIDAYMIEANTVWLANDYLQFTQSRQRAGPLGMEGATWFDYAVAARLLGPHEIGLQLLGAVVPAVHDRYSLFRDISLGKAPSFPLTDKGAPPSDSQMLGNWMRWFYPEIGGQPITPAAGHLRGYRDLLLMSDLDPNGIGMQFFRHNVETLAKTGKPVILYLPPLNPALKSDPVTVAYIDRLVSALRKEVDGVGSANIAFHPETVWANPQPSEYLDILHLNNGQGVIDMMVGLLEEKIGGTFKKLPLYLVYNNDPKAPK